MQARTSIQALAHALRDDTDHGSAWISVRALEGLRDYASRLPDGTSSERLVQAAKRLLTARPSMAALANRVHRAMHAARPPLSPRSVERGARASLRHARQAGEKTVDAACPLVSGRRVLTLSYSGTVRDVLKTASPAPAVIVAASEPLGEGVVLAETLSGAGLDVTLIPDAAVAHRLSGEGPEDAPDAVLVGADTVLPSGDVVNKAGTRAAALAAQREEVPFVVACAADKIRPDAAVHFEDGPARQVYDGDAPLSISNPTFDRTPADLVTTIATDRGRLSPDDVSGVAEDLKHLRTWASVSG